MRASVAVAYTEHDACGLSIFEKMPHETMLRVLEMLPPTGLLQAERVCHTWRSAVEFLALWPEWRGRGATLAESNLSIPGVPAFAFGAPPSEVSAEARAAAERASE